MSLIVAQGLTKHFTMGSTVVRALQDVSFEIDRGAFVAIMGSSGSGKTTLLDILGCLSQPTSGTYLLNDEEIGTFTDNQLAALRNREMGFVFQNFNLLGRTTALANVELPMLYNGVSRKKRIKRAEAALESVGLADRMDHRPNELSGGQRQRVSIARALVNNPSIVLADEPTGNLDTTSGAGILELFQELHGSGHTILMVTHEREVAEHADRIMTFRDGTLVKEERWNNNDQTWHLDYSSG